MAFSQQENYTDLVTAIGRRILVPTFADRGGVAWSARRTPPTDINLSFLDRNSGLVVGREFVF
jgi:hypothetical protein